MVEYQGRCDIEGNAVGHSPKVLEEYYNFIKADCHVSVMAPNVILKSATEEIANSGSKLEHHIVMGGKKSLFQKINDKLHMFSNIKKALRATDADTVWFFNVEYDLMLYLFLHRKPKRKIVCTFFLDGYHNGMVGKIKQWIFEKAQKKIDLIISTGPKLKFKNCKYEYIPDYYYIKDKYEVLRRKTKIDRAVCLGTMSGGKLLEDMVDAFNNNGYPLYVAGRFFDKNRLCNLNAVAKDNIVIEDKYLSDDDYFEILSTSRYTVLPYSKSQYNTQTSGVMQEAMFTDSIVVTFNDILEGNEMVGIGFEEFAELTKDMLIRSEEETENILSEYNTMRNTVYSIDSISEKYLKIFA